LKWYAMRTQVGKEERSVFLVNSFFRDVTVLFPKRRLSWRKKGEVFDVVKPLFSGYFFVRAHDNQVRELDFWLRVKRPDIWFVKMGNMIIPVLNEEMQLVQQLMCNGDIVEKSKIYKNGDKIEIVSGPLVGLEGIVERYSGRNRRVTVKIAIGGEEKRVELDAYSLKN